MWPCLGFLSCKQDDHRGYFIGGPKILTLELAGTQGSPHPAASPPLISQMGTVSRVDTVSKPGGILFPRLPLKLLFQGPFQWKKDLGNFPPDPRPQSQAVRFSPGPGS